jgi:class 3 adenylate cyclase/tetratricopeptide (TPR) repeat protein
MAPCPNCGGENSEQARFCQHCGNPLAPAAPAREVRKTVTVLFADVSGSTSLGERLDPESMRRVMGRFFDEMRGVLEHHGGTVEKFIGDAVMAVFGIPTLHEDDALRAVRAAAGMGEALAALNVELERDHGVTLAVRIGVDTGPVVAGDASAGQTMVTGDAVNVAARLEQAAAPGEILLGDPTYRLVRDAVRAEPLEPLSLKGKAQTVPAHRLIALVPGAEAFPRRLQSPMVGRGRDLALLRLAFDRVAGERTCHLATVLGAAGVGKSRLVEEFLRTAEADAEVLRGRCLSYGEGITFFPVVQAVKQAAGITDDEPASSAMTKLEGLVSGEDGADLIAQRVSQVIGLTEGSAVPEETSWAIRRLLEAMAKRRPLILVFDDIHWAEPAFLDLVESIADLSRDAPMLVLCLARQEFLDHRPAWGGGKLNATSILLEPLTEPQCEELIANMLGRAELAAEVQARIAQAAEGNPLFVEELLAMLIDDGLLARDNGHWIPTRDLSNLTVPPTIQALLAARLDRLGREERAVIERASVGGRVFYRGAVTALAPAALKPAVPQHLVALVRRELIRPQPEEFAGDDTYKFRHILIRDAAYEAMPKETRADLHERFAGWLETAAGERAREFEEILGYHLEQAYRYLEELGPLDERGRALAERAGRLLAPAGLRALARGDVTGASNLLGRAHSLLPTGDLERVRIMPELGAAMVDLGRFDQARQLLEDAIREAEESGERAAEIRARGIQVILVTRTDPTYTFAEALAESERLVAMAEEVGERDTLLYAWRILAQMRIWSGDSAGAEEAVDQALAEAGSEEFDRRGLELYRAVFTATVWGSTPVEHGLARWEAVLAGHHGPALEGWGWAAMAVMHAMSGRFDRAIDLSEQARSRIQQLGQIVPVAAFHSGFLVRMLAGDPRGAVDGLMPGTAILTELGETGYLSTSAAMLAEGFCALGEYMEAERWTKVSEETSAPDDVVSQSLWRAARAKVLASGGAFEEAERLAREAVEILATSDQFSQQGDMLMGLVEVLTRASREQEAIPQIEEAIRRYEQKGNVVSAGRARELLAEIEAQSGP